MKLQDFTLNTSDVDLSVRRCLYILNTSVNAGCFTSWTNYKKLNLGDILNNLRRDLFYLLDYVTRRSEKLRFKKKLVQRQIGEKFPNIGVLLFPGKMLCC